MQTCTEDLPISKPHLLRFAVLNGVKSDGALEVIGIRKSGEDLAERVNRALKGGGVRSNRSDH